MRDLLECLQRFSADALGGRILRDKIWKLPLQIDQLLVKPIVVSVANDRGGFLVVETVVLADFTSQLRDTFRGLLLLHWHIIHDTSTRNLRQSSSKGVIPSGARNLTFEAAVTLASLRNAMVSG